MSSAHKGSSIQPLTHCGLGMAYGGGEQGHHWLRWWLGACLAPSHYLNQCWLIVIHIGTNFNEIWIEIPNFPLKKMYSKLSVNGRHFVQPWICFLSLTHHTTAVRKLAMPSSSLRWMEAKQKSTIQKLQMANPESSTLITPTGPMMASRRTALGCCRKTLGTGMQASLLIR